MNLSTLKEHIKSIDSLHFQLPDGQLVPSHYHVTEVGMIQKDFIDCGGTIRKEKVVNFQLWFSDDVDHSLQPKRLLDIIELSEEKLGLGDFEIEVEYQAGTIGKFGLAFDGKNFLLTNKMTDCLAADKCIPNIEKPKVDLNNLITNQNSCTPGGGCC
jgi:hypothetical protein